MASRTRIGLAGVLSFAMCTVALMGPSGSRSAAAAGPNVVSQWDKIAEDTVVGSGAFQNEGWVYMAYEGLAVYDAVVAIEGGFRSYGPPIHAPAGASADAAAVEAAYEILVHHFPASSATLAGARSSSLAAIGSGQAVTDGIQVGHDAADGILAVRSGDGLQTPVASTSTFPTRLPGPGVWRLTPPAYAAPQTPWLATMRPFIVPTADRYLPPRPPSLSSKAWAKEFKEVAAIGRDTSTTRTPDQTATAVFWSANVIRQYSRLVRDVAESKHLDLLETARLAAMVDAVAADAGISVMNAKYHYLFWRPVSAIDPTSVKPAGDGFGPVPGVDDGNPATTEQVGWRPLLTTPNHPEYPAAHGTLTSAMAEVFSRFLGTKRIDVDIHGFSAAGAAGNLDAVHHFDRVSDLRTEIVNARLWAGLHYRGSSDAGVDLGRSVAKYDLKHAFGRIH
jgi:hypothetical protein